MPTHQFNLWSQLLCSGLVTAMGASPLYISQSLGSFMMPLMHWISEATLEKRRECFEPWDEDLELEFDPNLKKTTTSWVASVLEFRAILVRVKWSLESLLLLVFDGTQTVLVIGRFLVSSWSLWEPQEWRLYTVWSSSFRRWRKSILSGDLLLCGARELYLSGCYNMD